MNTAVAPKTAPVEESLGIAECYVKAGCDYLQVSTGIQDIDFIEHDESLPYNRIAALGVMFHEHFKGIVPVSCVNGIRTPEQVHYLLDNDLRNATAAKPAAGDRNMPISVPLSFLLMRSMHMWRSRAGI